MKAAPIGDVTLANRRTILKYIHPDGIKSCQLVLGFTEFEPGSLWNTMPPHTHSRRTEIYMYFDLGEQMVVHLMGEPQKTRHIIVRDREVVLSPAWSIHLGCWHNRKLPVCLGHGRRQPGVFRHGRCSDRDPSLSNEFLPSNPSSVSPEKWLWSLAQARDSG